MTKTIAAALAAYASDEDLKAAKRRMGAAMPDQGWLADYLRAVTPLTDAPVEFHLASGLCALSAAVGNRLYTESWGQNVFPNLWVVIVAPSSFWRKSTSINQAEALLRLAAPTRVYPSDFSREKLIKLLAEEPAGMLSVKEFGGFLASMSRDYNAGTKETLTELYDGPDLYTRALQSGVIEIRRPALTMLGATTLDWLEGKITEGDLQGGFLARYLFVTARDKASAKGLTGAMDQEQKNDLVARLHHAYDRPQQRVYYEPAARQMLDDWALGWEAEVTGTSHRSDLSGFAVRLQTYALKLAMLYRVSATANEGATDEHRIDELSAAQAIAYCRLLWSNVTGLIDEKIAISKDAKELRRILSIVGAGCTKSDALKLSKLRARDFDQFLDTLLQSGQLYSRKVRSSEVGLDRARDTMVTWLSLTPPPSENGHSGSHSGSLQYPEQPDLAAPVNPSGTTGEPEEEGNPRELEGPDLSSESPSSSTSLSLSTSHDSLLGIYTRGREGTGAWLGRYSKESSPRRAVMLAKLGQGVISKDEINERLLAEGHAAALTHVLDLLAARSDQDDPEAFL